MSEFNERAGTAMPAPKKHEDTEMNSQTNCSMVLNLFKTPFVSLYEYLL